MTARILRPGNAAGLTLLTLAALLSGCAAGAATQPGSGTQATATGLAATSAAAPSAPAGPAWTALKDSTPYKALTPQQQQKISALEAMDLDTFEKQSRDDQLAYGAFLREVYQQDAIAGTAGNGPDPALPAARKVSSSDAGQQIINDQLLKAVTARWIAQSDACATATPAADGGNYSKMAPSRVSPLFPEAYDAVSSLPPAPGDASGLPDSTGMVVDDESNNFIPMDGSWEELQFKIIQMQNTATQARTQFWFAFTPFTNIHGEADGVWILMFKAEESQEKWIPDLSVID